MKYELILETENCDSFHNFSHDRKGLTEALKRIEDARSKEGFISAKIVSDRDGLIFSDPNI